MSFFPSSMTRLLDKEQGEDMHRARGDIDWEKVGLGKKTDGQIARELGCSSGYVGANRRRMGILPFDEKAREKLERGLVGSSTYAKTDDPPAEESPRVSIGSRSDIDTLIARKLAESGLIPSEKLQEPTSATTPPTKIREKKSKKQKKRKERAQRQAKQAEKQIQEINESMKEAEASSALPEMERSRLQIDDGATTASQSLSSMEIRAMASSMESLAGEESTRGFLRLCTERTFAEILELLDVADVLVMATVLQKMREILQDLG